MLPVPSILQLASNRSCAVLAPVPSLIVTKPLLVSVPFAIAANSCQWIYRGPDCANCWRRIVIGASNGCDSTTVRSGLDEFAGKSRPEVIGLRSEERRVGKEWRSRWSPYH